MASGLDVLHIAQSQLGFVEGPNNATPYGTWFGIPNQPYCAMGISWCFSRVGLSHLVAAQSPKGFASCQIGLNWFQRQGQIVNKYQGQPGDIVFFSFSNNGQADHVELLEAASPAGITTIGFNTSPDHALNASQQNGGGCYRRHRPYLNVIAIARPRYPVIVKPKVAVSKTKKATAGVATTGALVAGATGMNTTGTTGTTTPDPSPSPSYWAAPPFPLDKTSFIMGAKSDAVLAVEMALAKAGLLPQQYVDAIMDAQTTNALKKYEAKNPKLGVKDGSVNQAVYDALKATI